MIWVLIQAILFAGILVLDVGRDFSAHPLLLMVALFATIDGFIILGLAVYNLRHSLSVAPAPNKNGRLQTKGIYSVVRHPMYVAVWLIMAASVINAGSWIKVGLFVLLVIFFVLKTRHEEKLLVKKYPSYKKYMETVGGFIPRISR